MDNHFHTEELTFEPSDAHRLAALCGQFNGHIKQIEQRLQLDIRIRENTARLTGPQQSVALARDILRQLYKDTETQPDLSPDHVHLAIQESLMDTAIEEVTLDDAAPNADIEQAYASVSMIKTKKCTVKPRGGNQSNYVMAVRANDINFGIGPAGTGKTYLAVACAVEALLKDEIERILLVRPAVEAGEKLGFLPGDLSQKVDPYLRPLYDALYEMLGFEIVEKLIERSVIEVAPLAYMRGRTLNNAFVILDESQNTTREQMKMFLTRIGFGSTAVITGDPSQVDLPRGAASGLRHAIEILEGVEGISFTYFTSRDVVRHPIVQRIVDAYEKAEAKAEKIAKEEAEERARLRAEFKAEQAQRNGE
ncbi:PhoH family protein [Saccharophagus degradans]|uniref:PhoH-like protein n=2 Tax=Saccharophagus degradans TaxID=86304 RepID=Q21FH3_SACD2|nr:PhoH family protein [Saccharophagus degradans]ABD82556.1 PhoH-like protein [Saccharophagus degradans 2-40]MBU2985254.1 PhoH family protein [Saccharophagus degradans]MDO6424446.1 PhoH family protein [Saccharophagus degradans]MDO6608347.1 PhoH family protein [Saccharophagus degradans]WGO99258.1 PhoH family protein [Saccharophagus degradans]